MAASEFAELELNFSQPIKGSFFLAMRFTPAASDATQDSPAYPLALDFSVLRSIRGLPAYGSLLAQQVFSGGDASLRSHFQRFRDQAANVPLRIRVNIGIDASELQEIDWEALQDPVSGALLSTGERVWFSRFLISQDPRSVQLQPRDQLRAIAVVAGPPAPGLDPIDVAGETERARKALEGISQLHCLPGENERATLDNIIASMRPRTDILYLVCHGRFVQGKSVLLLEDEQGKPQLVPGEKLVEQIGAFLQPPRLVVLVSCDSLSARGENLSSALVALGPLLASAGVPAVLAMHGQVSMSTISRFMPAFFQDLSQSGQIDRAVAVARGSVRDAPDAWMPALFLRSRTGKLWQEEGSQPSSQPDLFGGAALQRQPASAPAPSSGDALTTTLSLTDVQVAENFAHLVQFVDRTGEFQRFYESLTTPLEQRAERILAFSGETGMGKYWLLSRLQFECSFRRGMHCAYLDLEDINLQEPLDIMTGLAGQLSGAPVRRWLDLYQAWRFGSPDQAATETPYAKNPIQAVAVLSEAFLKMLSELAQETAVVLLIDSLDTTEIQEATRRWVMDTVLDKARAIRGFGVLPVVSLTQPPDFTDRRWSKLEIHTYDHSLERLGKEDIVQYFRLRGLPEEVIQASLQECADKTEGIPALVAAFARSLKSRSRGSG